MTNFFIHHAFKQHHFYRIYTINVHAPYANYVRTTIAFYEEPHCRVSIIRNVKQPFKYHSTITCGSIITKNCFQRG